MGARLRRAFLPAFVSIAVLALQAVPAPAETKARDLQRAASSCDLGNKALNAGDVKKAQEHFQKALELVPAYPDAHLGLGNVLMKQGRFAEALKEFETCRDSFGVIGDAIFDLRVQQYQAVQHQLTTYRDGLSTLRTELNSAKGDPAMVQKEIAEVEDSIGKLEAVEMPTKGTAKEAPGEVWFHIGNAQFRLGRMEDAVASWETCAAKSPKFAQVQVNLAVAYWKKGRFEDAKKALGRAADLGFPVNPQMKADLDKAAAAAAATPAPAGGSPSPAPPAPGAPSSPPPPKP